jgi:hypothetical protein
MIPKGIEVGIGELPRKKIKSRLKYLSKVI